MIIPDGIIGVIAKYIKFEYEYGSANFHPYAAEIRPNDAEIYLVNWDGKHFLFVSIFSFTHLILLDIQHHQ